MPHLSDINATDSLGQRYSGKIKLGIVLDSRPVPGWACYVIRKLSSCKAIDPVLVIQNSEGKLTLGSDRGPILFRLWTVLDRWLRKHRTDALQRRDSGYLLRDNFLPVMFLQTCNTNSSSEIVPIKTAKFDLLVNLGSETLASEILACARLGTWSVRQGDVSGAPGIPGLFWDMYEGNCITRYGPQVVEQKRNCTRVVYSSCGVTNFLSLALNQNAAFWEIADALVSRLSDPESLRRSVQSSSGAAASPQSNSRRLSNVRMAGFLVQWTMRIMRNELRKRLFREQWSIVLGPNTDTSKEMFEHDLRIIRPPRDRFYADPFLIETNGHTYLFFEDYSFSSSKGVISCCELDAHGNCSKPRVVLERNYHLSYPFLFTWQGQLYMIPETRDNGTIEMYRAKDFPHVWVLEAVLMSNVAATDSTLLYYHDKWWLFAAGMREHASPDYPLWLFFSDSPMGPWTAHPKNPIVSDPTRSRPAGSLFFDNGELIRPGQDCSRGYGYAAHLHHVTVLSETDFQETLVASLLPDQILGSSGIHTFNQSASFRVMDCKFLISRLNVPSLSRVFRKFEAKYSTSFACEPAKDSR
jgi:hypothetical protein